MQHLLRPLPLQPHNPRRLHPLHQRHPSQSLQPKGHPNPRHVLRRSARPRLSDPSNLSKPNPPKQRPHEHRSLHPSSNPPTDFRPLLPLPQPRHLGRSSPSTRLGLRHRWQEDRFPGPTLEGDGLCCGVLHGHESRGYEKSG